MNDNTLLNNRSFIVKKNSAIRYTSTNKDTLAIMNIFRPILQQVSDILRKPVHQIAPNIEMQRTHVS